jgi:hypothetical protein
MGKVKAGNQGNDDDERKGIALLSSKKCDKRC